jgi:hypothetical protein
MSTAQLQTPSFLRPHIESDNIRLLLDGIEYREGNPLWDAECLLQTGEELVDAGLVLVTKEEVWNQMWVFFTWLAANYPSDYTDDDAAGEEIIFMSQNNRFYLEDYCASAMTKKQLDLLTENKFKRDKLKTLYRESYASHMPMKGPDEVFDPFKMELKDEARQWFKEIPERSPFAKEGWHQPHVRGPLKAFLKQWEADKIRLNTPLSL